MIDDHTQMLIATVKKLYHRGAEQNIRKILAKSHVPDIAEVLSGFDAEDRFNIFKMEEDIERRAELLSYLSKEHQQEMVQHLERQELFELVNLMDSDDAADLLGHLPEEDAKAVLSSMVKEDSEEVADLMGYPEDSAGGLMSADYLALSADLTVQQAIVAIQSEENESAIAFYIYVINDSEKLIGVLSLKQLLLSKKSETLGDIMQPDVVSVNVEAHQEEVARTVERYDFLSLPVVDPSGDLVGVVTVDDILDVIREEAEGDLLQMAGAGWGVDVSTFEHFKARIPWLTLSFIGGVFCFAIVHFFGFLRIGIRENSNLWLVAAFIPLLLSVGATTGSQAVTVAVGAIRMGRFEVPKWFSHFKKELKLAFIFAFVFGFTTWGLGEWLFADYGLSITLALAVVLQILLSMLVGSSIPILVNKLGVDPTLASVPLFAALADVSAVAILFALLHGFM